VNYPLWSLPAPGLLVACVAILHVFISHFAVGGGLFLVVTERKARREHDDEMLGYVRRHSAFFMLLTLVLGAVTGVGIWFTIGLVHPQATSSLILIFVWAWAIEWTFFVIEIAAAMVYYYGWDRLDAATHERVGWVYFWAAWLSLAVINGILAFMLTPGAWLTTGNMWDGLINPTYWPSLAARTFTAIGLAGLYVLLTAAGLANRDLKARVTKYAAWWILPMTLALPLAVVWFLWAASHAGVEVLEVLGLKAASLGDIAAALISGSVSGYPPAIVAGRAVIVASLATLLMTLLVAFWRPRAYGRLAALAVLAAAIVAMGGGEWVREDLRKPYIVGRYMFVNGVRLAPAWTQAVAATEPAVRDDRFELSALRQAGVLRSASWTRLQPSTASADPLQRAEADGREVFRLSCTMCHTIDGYLAIRPLVADRSQEAIASVLARLTTSDEQPASSSALWTWRGRRMPPFPGTDAEREDVAIYLARLGGTAPHLPAAAGASATAELGEAYFNDNCSPCHGPGTDIPLGGRGLTAARVYELLGHLPTVNPAMPAFEGSDQLRRALAGYVASLPAPKKKGGAR
jgi:mono/diheme cytochrome c family protein/cytochrome bd-type quinol oxidase subunit 1